MATPVLAKEDWDLSSNGRHGRKRIQRHRNDVLRLFLSNLAENDLVPEQLSDENGRKSQPEKDMWFALLKDAIGCYVNRDATSRRKMRLAHEAEEWFSSQEYFQGTFLWVCDFLDLNDSYLRQGIEKLRQTEGCVYKLEKGGQHDFLGEEFFPQEKIIACVRSFHKIEFWRGLSNSAVRLNNLGCWRRLFAYALRTLSKPKLSFNDIGEILGCSHMTAINLYYKAIKAYRNGDKQFMYVVEEFKERQKTWKQWK